MNNLVLSNSTVEAQADAAAELFNGSRICIYGGAKQPADADDALPSGAVLGVTLRLGDPAFAPAAFGVLIANPIEAGIAVATVIPTFARIYAADKSSLMDCSVGEKDCNITLGKITEGAMVGLSSFRHVVRKDADTNE